MLTLNQLTKIQATGIIPDELLEDYLDGKNLIKPTGADSAVEWAIENRYAEHKANQLRAQKASLRANGVGF